MGIPKTVLATLEIHPQRSFKSVLFHPHSKAVHNEWSVIMCDVSLEDLLLAFQVQRLQGSGAHSLLVDKLEDVQGQVTRAQGYDALKIMLKFIDFFHISLIFNFHLTM